MSGCKRSHIRVNFSVEVILQGHSNGPTEEVEDDDVGDVELGKEPAVVLRPIWHHRVSRKEGFLGELGLVGALGHLDHAAGEDDVGAPGVHWVVVLLSAVVALGKKYYVRSFLFETVLYLSQRHCDARLRIHFQVMEADLERCGVDVRGARALSQGAIAQAADILHNF